MFIGHYGVALAAKKLAPRTSLGVLFLSAQFLDLLWPIFVLVGVEHVRVQPGNTVVTPLDFYDYPITHSLVGVLAWSIVLGFVYYAARRYPVGAWVTGTCVLSHWLLDAVVHRADLPLLPGRSPTIGLGLWNSLLGTVVVELGIFLLGLILYLREAAARDRVGRYALGSLVALLLLLYAANLMSPPPPSDRAVAWVGVASWVFVPWAWWIDRHRRLRSLP